MAQVTCFDPICPMVITNIAGWMGPISKDEAYGIMLKYKRYKCEVINIIGYGGGGEYSSSFPLIQGSTIAAGPYGIYPSDYYSVTAVDSWGGNQELGQVCLGSQLSGKISYDISGSGGTGYPPTIFQNNITNTPNYNISDIFNDFSQSWTGSTVEYITDEASISIGIYNGEYYVNPRYILNLYSNFISSYPIDFSPVAGVITFNYGTTPLTGNLYSSYGLSGSVQISAKDSWNYNP